MHGCLLLVQSSRQIGSICHECCMTVMTLMTRGLPPDSCRHDSSHGAASNFSHNYHLQPTVVAVKTVTYNLTNSYQTTETTDHPGLATTFPPSEHCDNIVTKFSIIVSSMIMYYCCDEFWKMLHTLITTSEWAHCLQKYLEFKKACFGVNANNNIGRYKIFIDWLQNLMFGSMSYMNY